MPENTATFATPENTATKIIGLRCIFQNQRSWAQFTTPPNLIQVVAPFSSTFATPEGATKIISQHDDFGQGLLEMAHAKSPLVRPSDIENGQIKLLSAWPNGDFWLIDDESGEVIESCQAYENYIISQFAQARASALYHTFWRI